MKSLRDGKVFASSQNHVYVVDDADLPADVEVTYRNATDRTVEGLEIREGGSLLAYTVQFHPEGGPSPQRPGGLIGTLGGQTGLNVTVGLHEAGVLEPFGVKMLGTSSDAILAKHLGAYVPRDRYGARRCGDGASGFSACGVAGAKRGPGETR